MVRAKVGVRVSVYHGAGHVRKDLVVDLLVRTNVGSWKGRIQ